MSIVEHPTSLTPEEFELAVKGILDAAAGTLLNYESRHLDALAASDGEYVFDVTARFEALGAGFLVLVECKHHRRKVERQDVQVLHSKLQSVGAQKGMLFSTAGFQSGAIEYADAHGIALIQIKDGGSSWLTRSTGAPTPPPPWVRIPKYVGWWHNGSSICLISEDHVEYTRRALGLPGSEP
ncbi:restriction endonuclease [Luteimonas deserti]|uniref:Restriction endonuclease n=1 Tax=Luteimonas deserti TaxID=2752306 RepID=A0A7Z0QRD7_9GAMM|nr:restriction endonuclease [Luteimonas deserti]